MKIAVSGRVPDAASASGIHRLLSILHEEGAELCCHEPLCVALSSFGRAFVPDGTFDTTSAMPADTAMILALGGDGTFLSALEMAWSRDIPVAGINFGRLGFLTAAGMGEDARAWAADLVSGRCSIQERSVLKVDYAGLPDGFFPMALNEFVIRRDGPQMLSIDVSVDGRPLPTYWADGIMVVTPTGSTAYSLSLGGPVVMPDSHVILITPLASHNLNVRPLVIPQSAEVEVVIHTRDGHGLLMADNRSVTIPAGEKLVFMCAASPLRCVTFDDNFINALKTKLFWGEDRRNH